MRLRRLSLVRLRVENDLSEGTGLGGVGRRRKERADRGGLIERTSCQKALLLGSSRNER